MPLTEQRIANLCDKFFTPHGFARAIEAETSAPLLKRIQEQRQWIIERDDYAETLRADIATLEAKIESLSTYVPSSLMCETLQAQVAELTKDRDDMHGEIKGGPVVKSQRETELEQECEYYRVNRDIAGHAYLDMLNQKNELVTNNLELQAKVAELESIAYSNDGADGEAMKAHIERRELRLKVASLTQERDKFVDLLEKTLAKAVEEHNRAYAVIERFPYFYRTYIARLMAAHIPSADLELEAESLLSAIAEYQKGGE